MMKPASLARWTALASLVLCPTVSAQGTARGVLTLPAAPRVTTPTTGPQIPAGLFTGIATPLGAPCDTATLTGTLPNIGSLGKITISGAGPNSMGALYFSRTETSNFVGSCEIILETASVFTSFTTSGDGVSELLTVVPSQVELFGTSMTFQALVMSGLGPVTSNGYEVTNALRLSFGHQLPTNSSVRMNELYVSHAGSDDQEFIELIGAPGSSLDNHAILSVEGEGSTRGQIDKIIDLTGFVIPADGFFVLGSIGVENIDLALNTANNFENNTQTFYLVDAGTPETLALLEDFMGTDLDPDGDSATAIPDTVNVLDIAGFARSNIDDDTGRVYDGAPIFRDGNNSAAGAYRYCDWPSPFALEDFLDFQDEVNEDAPRTPGASNSSIADPGFEAGTGSGAWTEFSALFGTPLCTVALCGTGGGTGPDTGESWAWFGGTIMPEFGSLEQSVRIPNGANLTFRLEQPAAAGSLDDYFQVLVDGNIVFQLINDGTAAVGYETIEVDISAFADGEDHLLRFESELFGSGSTNFFVDNVCWTNPTIKK